MKAFWICLAIVLMLVGLIIVIVLSSKIRNKHIESLRNNIASQSCRYKRLIDLMEEMKFNKDIKQGYKFAKYVNSKAKYDKFNFDTFFKSKIIDEIDKVDELIDKVKQNKEKYIKYQEIFNIIYSSVPFGNNKKEIEYYDMEKKMLLECRDTISTDPMFICIVTYISPQGRNRYDNDKYYSFEDLIYMRDKVKAECEEKNTEAYRKKVERRKMTDSLRYDVMERDGFRCRLCGRSASQGAVLEVDHIKPISKGGKTTMSNLQTLCKECNRGKRDKYNDCLDDIDF